MIDGLDQSGQHTVTDPYWGLLISGALRLDALIGLGTTGRVYRASQIGFDRKLAVKVIHRHLMKAPAIRDRFHREARLAARLIHPGIVRILGSGELEVQNAQVGGEAYLVYEYLEGQTLRELLDEPWPLAQALAYMIAIADAVGSAHGERIIHRDLKPENLMTIGKGDSDTRHVVLDFGLARTLDHDHDPLTHDGAILGTPQYMSPEAARGQPATPRSDVYAMATMLYELLAGRPPFEADSPMMVLLQQAEADPPPLPEHCGVPVPIRDFIRRELAKQPGDRSPEGHGFALGLWRACRASGLDVSNLVLPQISDALRNQLIEGPS